MMTTWEKVKTVLTQEKSIPENTMPKEKRSKSERENLQCEYV